MNWDQIEGNWEQMKGEVKKTWGKLTSDDIMVIKGKKQDLTGKLQERYGLAKEAAEKEVEKFMSSCKECSSDKDVKKDGSCH